MTMDEAREAGGLVGALSAFTSDRGALQAHVAKNPRDTVEVSFYEPQGSSIATGTEIPAAFAVPLLDVIIATIRTRLVELGVDVE